MGQPGSAFNSICRNYHCCPSSGIENDTPESQYFGQKFFISFILFDAVDAHLCGNMRESMRISKYRNMAIPSQNGLNMTITAVNKHGHECS